MGAPCGRTYQLSIIFGCFSELGLNRVVSRVLAQFDAIVLQAGLPTRADGLFAERLPGYDEAQIFTPGSE